MSENVLTLGTGDRPLNQSLGFGASSVVVDNFTASYLQLPDTGKSVPPWVYGAVVSLPLGINRARASLLATVPAIPGPPVPPALAVCTMTWTDAALAASPGHLLQQSVVTQPAELANLASPGNSTGSITLPAGTQSLAIVTQVSAGDTSSMSLTGASSGFPYYSQALGSSAYEIIGVESAVDTVLNYNVGHGGGAGASFFITALPFPPPSFIQRTAAPWEVPTLFAPLNQNIGHGTSFTWITPPAGRSLRLFGGFLHWRTSTNGFGAVKGDGTTGGLQNYDQVATNFLQMNYGGGKLQPNEKLLISNDDSGNGQNLNGGLAYALD